MCMCTHAFVCLPKCGCIHVWYARTHPCTHTCTACLHLRVHTCTYPHVSICGPTCVHVQCVFSCPCVAVHVCDVCACTAVYMPLWGCAQVHTHACTCVGNVLWFLAGQRLPRRGVQEGTQASFSSFVHLLLGLWLRSGHWSWAPQVLTTTPPILRPLVDLGGQDCLLTSHKGTLKPHCWVTWERLVRDPCAGAEGGPHPGPGLGMCRVFPSTLKQGVELGVDPGGSDRASPVLLLVC